LAPGQALEPGRGLDPEWVSAQAQAQMPQRSQDQTSLDCG